MSENAEGSPMASRKMSESTAFYLDFLQNICKTKRSLLEMNDNTSQLNYHAFSTIQGAATMFDPKTLSILHDIEEQGRRMDKLVVSTQEMKKELLSLAERDNTKPVDYYRAYLESLNLLEIKNL